MTEAEALQELSDRGFDYLTEARRRYMLTQGGLFVIHSDLWSWRRTSEQVQSNVAGDLVSGAVALFQSTSGIVDNVALRLTNDTRTPLTYASYDTYSNASVDERTGNDPAYYTPASLGDNLSPALFLWPAKQGVNYDAVVTYWRDGYGADLQYVLDMVPEAMHSLVMDRAVCLAYRDSDNHQAAESLHVDIERRLNQFRISYMDSLNASQGVRVTERW